MGIYRKLYKYIFQIYVGIHNTRDENPHKNLYRNPLLKIFMTFDSNHYWESYEILYGFSI